MIFCNICFVFMSFCHNVLGPCIKNILVMRKILFSGLTILSILFFSDNLDSEEKNNLISNTASIMLNSNIGVDQNYSSLSYSSYLSSNQFYIAEKMGSLLKALPNRICDQMAWNGFVIVLFSSGFLGRLEFFDFASKYKWLIVLSPTPILFGNNVEVILPY